MERHVDIDAIAVAFDLGQYAGDLFAGGFASGANNWLTSKLPCRSTGTPVTAVKPPGEASYACRVECAFAARWIMLSPSRSVLRL